MTLPTFLAHPRPVTFRKSAPTILILAAAIAILAVTGVSQHLTSGLLESSRDGDYQLMQQIVAHTLKSAEEKSLNRAELVASFPAVRAAFLAHDRAKLLAECAKMYEIQRVKHGLEQATFHVPPGAAFLRLQDPAKFGDDESSYRVMLADAYENKAVRSGTSITRGGPAILGIVPIFDDAGKLAGTFETGLSFAPLLDRMKEAYGLESVVFFDEKELRSRAPELPGDVITSKNRVGRFIRYHATQTQLATDLVTDRDVETNDVKRYTRDVAGTLWGVELLPLYSYSHQQIGVVAVATSFGEDRSLARRAQVWVFLAAVFAIVLLAGMILVVVRGLLLAPVAALGERMAALADGDASKPADPPETYCAELQPLAESYERIRKEKAE